MIYSWYLFENTVANNADAIEKQADFQLIFFLYFVELFAGIFR